MYDVAAAAHEKAASLQWKAFKPDMGHGPETRMARSDRAHKASEKANDLTNDAYTKSENANMTSSRKGFFIDTVHEKSADALNASRHGSADTSARWHVETAAMHRELAQKHGSAR